jgi:hypothetical protein
MVLIYRFRTILLFKYLYISLKKYQDQITKGWILGNWWTLKENLSTWCSSHRLERKEPTRARSTMITNV